MARTLPRTAFRKGHTPWCKGKKLSPEHIQKLSASHMGQKAWNKGKKTGNFGNGFKASHVPWNTGLNKENSDLYKVMSELRSGKNHFNWKGGTSSKRSQGYRHKKVIRWRKAVFERDNYTCQKCGNHGGNLVAHHKKRWADYPKLRYVVSNGITLCKNPCHAELKNHTTPKPVLQEVL